LQRAILKGMTFLDAELSCADLSRSMVNGGDFERANLTGANLSGAQISGAEFSFAWMVSAIFCDCKLLDTNFRKATLRDGRVETIGLKRLTSDQARAAGLRRLRYTAFATTGAWCLARLESFDRVGHMLWRSGSLRKQSCQPGE